VGGGNLAGFSFPSAFSFIHTAEKYTRTHVGCLFVVLMTTFSVRRTHATRHAHHFVLDFNKTVCLKETK